MKQDHFELNASLNLVDADGKMQLNKDQDALREYFREDVNKNTVFFHSLEEKMEYLVNEDYYEKEVIDQYSFKFIKKLFKRAYGKKFRFKSFVGAYKYYTGYTMKTFDGKRFLERYEDRVCMNALYLAEGDEQIAIDLLDEIMSGRFQPATPTFLNCGKKQRGELVSCFLLRMEDNMESISRSINAALQLSKRGGGVAFMLTNLREKGAPIKKIKGQSSGVIPVMKMFEDAFSYANQLGSRTGAGAVYLHAHHPDILEFMDTKRENADEKIRIKTLSTGVVIPDITYRLAKENKEMYLFSPYDVERVYGVPFSEVDITEKYYEMVDNPEITKTKTNARSFFTRIAELQFESGYPFILNTDTATKASAFDSRINMSNLCVAPESKILTDKGYIEISELEDQTVKVWNGQKFSETIVRKTGENQKLVRVKTTGGADLECTPYHKFYVKTGYGQGDVVRKEARELQAGDKLIKPDSLPVIQGDQEYTNAYANGFYCGDGCLTRSGKRIYLYHEKRDEGIKERLGNIFENWYVQDEQKREYGHSPLLKDKFAVPMSNYTVTSRLDWFAGLCDSDGTVSRNGKTQTIQIGSINKTFLEDVQMMLQTLGVSSKINLAAKEGFREMPMNDGSGKSKDYCCQEAYRLLVGQHELSNLLSLGLTFTRLQIDTDHKANRECIHFNKVVSVEDEGRIDDTYCFTEKERNMGMFNGLLTGQCSEILQTNSASEYSEDGSYTTIGKDISCNLGSMNVAMAMESPDLGKTVETAVRALTAVSDKSNIKCVPSIHEGNQKSHAIGLGQMNLAGFFAKEEMYYGDEASLDFTNLYFYTVAYHVYKASCLIAKERGEVFDGFYQSDYFTGEYFKKYTDETYDFQTEKVKTIFEKSGINLPTQDDWKKLVNDIKQYGLYHSNHQAVPPTGSISYLNNSTASIHPITDIIEKRKEAKIGRVYYPAPFLTNENVKYYQDAYKVGWKALIDVYAEATKHIDQGLSLTLFFPGESTTRDLNKAYIYAWRKGIKTLYYTRIRQTSLEGTEMEGCVSCSL